MQEHWHRPCLYSSMETASVYSNSHAQSLLSLTHTHAGCVYTQRVTSSGYHLFGFCLEPHEIPWLAALCQLLLLWQGTLDKQVTRKKGFSELVVSRVHCMASLLALVFDEPEHHSGARALEQKFPFLSCVCAYGVHACVYVCGWVGAHVCADVWDVPTSVEVQGWCPLSSYITVVHLTYWTRVNRT